MAFFWLYENLRYEAIPDCLVPVAIMGTVLHVKVLSTVMYKYIAFPIRIITFGVHIMDILHVGAPTSIEEMSFLLLTGLCFVLHHDSALTNTAMRCSKPQKLFSKDVQFPDNPFPYYTVMMKYRDSSSSYVKTRKEK